MKKRARIVSGLAPLGVLAALFLAPLAEASLTRTSAAERAIEPPALTLTSPAPEPSEFSLFEGTELASAAPESEREPSFHPLAAVSLFSKDGADPPLVSVDELIYPKTRYRVFDFLGAPLVGVERGVTLELHWGCADFSCGFASGTVVWLSQDPLGDKESPNLYGFVGARPHEKTDPLGLEGYEVDGNTVRKIAEEGRPWWESAKVYAGGGGAAAAAGAGRVIVTVAPPVAAGLGLGLTIKKVIDTTADLIDVNADAALAEANARAGEQSLQARRKRKQASAAIVYTDPESPYWTQIQQAQPGSVAYDRLVILHNNWVEDKVKAKKKVHRNSLETTVSAVGYSLRDRTTGAILKYGETTDPEERYSQKQLEEWNARLVIEGSGTKAEMHAWQHQKILEHVFEHGVRPPLNKSDY